MLSPKPSKNCGGCALYGSSCHCLCHVSIEMGGFHEIVYQSKEMKKSNLFQKLFNKLMRNNLI